MKTNILILLAFISLTTACQGQILNNSKSTEFGTFRFSDQDQSSVNDLIRISENKLPGIAKELQLKIDSKIIIEIYPSQNEFDINIINPNHKGAPAISGFGRIQLVSPLAKIKIDTISYNSRLLFLVHEYVHIFLDQLETPPPICIDEGLACYYTSLNFYKDIADKYLVKINFKPTIDQLLNHYNEIPAPDLFSCLFLDFLINSSEQKSFATIIRNPGNLIQKNNDWFTYLDKYFSLINSRTTEN